MGEIVDEYAEVGRPENSADMRIFGLDESITLDDIKEVVAKRGGCCPREVTAGGVNPGSGGMWGTLVRCPAWAARKVAEGGRIKVGWSQAQVKVLSRRMHSVNGEGARPKRTGAHSASGQTPPLVRRLSHGAKEPPQHHNSLARFTTKLGETFRPDKTPPVFTKAQSTKAHSKQRSTLTS
ncbi:unnamed protein product [Chilo suppressalis]|uniref:Uncharacterized protein n=1 Tax=Chilo suppressalis TaxID=168631 RepID=A0ABN8AZW5_CHISP|nr:unnamed protein product [Chilo suppressalis]